MILFNTPSWLFWNGFASILLMDKFQTNKSERKDKQTETVWKNK